MKILFFGDGGYQTFPIVDGMIEITNEEYSKVEKGELVWNGSKLVPYVEPPREVEPVVQPKPDYETLVVQKIRARYTVDQELAILRQRDTKPEEFNTYNTYCEKCKTEAKTIINK